MNFLSLLRRFTGTSQGLSPFQDGSTRAALLAIINGILVVVAHTIHLSDSGTLIVMGLGNPVVILISGFWDKVDSIIQLKMGVTTAPTVTQKNTEEAPQ